MPSPIPRPPDLAFWMLFFFSLNHWYDSTLQCEVRFPDLLIAHAGCRFLLLLLLFLNHWYDSTLQCEVRFPDLLIAHAGCRFCCCCCCLFFFNHWYDWTFQCELRSPDLLISRAGCSCLTTGMTGPFSASFDPPIPRSPVLDAVVLPLV